MARIAGVDMPKDKRVEIGLTYIYGIGRKSAENIIAATGINPDTRVKDLTEDDFAKLREEIEDVHANRDWLAIAMDAELVEEEQFDVVVLPQTLKVENGAVKLSRTPKDGEELLAYNKSTGEAVTIAPDGKVTGAEEGTIVLVASYKTQATKADVMEIGGEGAGRGFAMYLEESVFNNNMKVIATKTTYFPRVVPESSFSMEGSSELAEQNMTSAFTVSQGEGQDYLGQIIYVPVEE